MPLLGGFRIGRWFGFPVQIDYSWFLVAALVVWTFSAGEFPRLLPGYGRSAYVAMGTVAAVLFFLSVLLHELGHAVVARTRGITVESITLFVFGGIAQAREEAKRPLDEFLLTAAGPLTSLAIAGVFHAARLGMEAVAAPAPAVTVAGFLALLNFVLAVFNMIPGFPLDGGRIFRSLAWAATGDLVRATRWATWGGKAFGSVLIALGVYGALQGQLLGGLWAAFIGWFLVNAASTSFRYFELRQLLSRVPVSSVMLADPPRIPADVTLDRAIADHFLRGRRESYPVDLDGIVLGMVDVGAAAEVPEELRATTRVTDIMRPTYALTAAHPDEMLSEVVAKADPGESSLLVTVDRRLVGLLDISEIGSWARRMHRLGLLAEEEDPGGDVGGGRAGGGARGRGEHAPDPGEGASHPGEGAPGDAVDPAVPPLSAAAEEGT